MRWIIIPGLRGVGKTTIMHQLLSNHRPWLAKKGLDVQLLFISLDEVVYDLRTDLRTTLRAYEQILGHYFELTKQPIFLFVDEVQRNTQWSQTLKVIYDRCQGSFFVEGYWFKGIESDLVCVSADF